NRARLQRSFKLVDIEAVYDRSSSTRRLSLSGASYFSLDLLWTGQKLVNWALVSDCLERLDLLVRKIACQLDFTNNLPHRTILVFGIGNLLFAQLDGHILERITLALGVHLYSDRGASAQGSQQKLVRIRSFFGSALLLRDVRHEIVPAGLNLLAILLVCAVGN